MKRKTIGTIIIMILVYALLMTVLVLCFGNWDKTDKKDETDERTDDISIFTATDIHYISKELLGDGHYFDYPIGDGKVVNYSSYMTDAFLDSVIEQSPDVLILSGDLTLNGSLQSHTELCQKLRVVQESSVDVLVIPGNHDVDVTSASYAGENIETFPSVTSAEFMELYAEFGYENAKSKDDSTFSYIYEASDDLLIVMLDTNCYGVGYVKDSTLEWLESELAAAKSANKRVISVTHQNLYAHNELLYFGYQLYNADALMSLYEKYDVKCNFSGHIHVQSIYDDKIPEVATSSMSLSPVNYGVINYSYDRLSYKVQRVDVEAYAQKIGSDDENLLNFAEYSLWYFKKVSIDHTYARFAESDLDEETLEMLANTYTDINYAYFSGTDIDISQYREGIDMWNNMDNSFTKNYINSMTAKVGGSGKNTKIELIFN